MNMPNIDHLVPSGDVDLTRKLISNYVCVNVCSLFLRSEPHLHAAAGSQVVNKYSIKVSLAATEYDDFLDIRADGSLPVDVE